MKTLVADIGGTNSRLAIAITSKKDREIILKNIQKFKNSDFNKTLINRGFGSFSKINETEIIGYFNTNLSSLVINNKCYCQSTCDCPEIISEYQRWSGDFD